MADQFRDTDRGEPMGDPLRAQIGDILEHAESELIRAVTHQEGRTLGREALDRELRDLRDAVLRMGRAVEVAIEDALRALETRDVEAAARVVDGDAQINDMQREVSALITTVIATQQPVARDLRFLLALDHVGYELERIGDHARSVARHARTLGAGAPAPVTASDASLAQIGRLARRQLEAILQALLTVDDLAARRVAAADDEIDDRYHASFDDLLSMMRTGRDKVEVGTHLLLVAHDLERIGDRVTNIAEDVVFLATGDIEDLNP
jgi:phosphate transport system protein